MKNKHRRWLLIWFHSCYIIHMVHSNETEITNHHNGNSSSKESRGIFSPRMDYEQWKPLGRGDPLKNDPTYDYVPPVLERVHYWIDPALRKPDPPLPGENQKSEILVLGVSSKKPSGGSLLTDRRDTNFDPFLKFVEGPKFNSHQRIPRPHYTVPSSYYPSPFYNNRNKLQDRPSYLSKGEQRVPYTMLVPPPVNKRPETYQPVHMTPITSTASTPTQQNVSAMPNTTPEVTIQESNMVYQSTSSFIRHEFNGDGAQATFAEPSSHVTWRTPVPNITYMHGSRNHSKKVVQTLHMHQKEPTGIKENFVTFPPILKNNDQVMHKGQVTDDTMDLASTYVNIGKPEAQVHPSSDIEISSVQIPPPSMPVRQPPMMMNFGPSSAVEFGPRLPPLTLQSIQTMQTMQPPPTPVSSMVHKEPVTNEVQDYITSEIRLTPTTVSVTELPSQTTTTTTVLTTDPLFKHYKQPMEPIKGPMYLIIQGHSKVKTYGPSKQVNGISVQETNEIPTADEYSVKHLHGYKNKEGNPDRPQREGRSGNLQTLKHVVQTGLGAIDFPEIGVDRGKDVKETELVVKYDVSSDRKATTEKYRKGIVEEGDLSRNVMHARNGTVS